MVRSIAPAGRTQNGWTNGCRRQSGRRAAAPTQGRESRLWRTLASSIASLKRPAAWHIVSKAGILEFHATTHERLDLLLCHVATVPDEVLHKPIPGIKKCLMHFRP